MSTRNCACPVLPALPVLNTQDCSFQIKQIQRFLFRKSSNVTDLPMDDLAAMQVLKADVLTDAGIRVTQFGYLVSVSIPDPGTVTYGGGDNTTINGATYIFDNNLTAVNFEFIGLEPEIADEIYNFIKCNDVQVVFIDAQGRYIYKDVAGDRLGFNVLKDSSNISPLVTEGFGQPSKFIGTMVLSDWDGRVKIYDPNLSATPVYSAFDL